MTNSKLIGVLLGAAVIVCTGGGAARAATCSAYPYTLTNGTTADANQVMGNFNNILNCANNNVAPLANPSFTGNVGIGTGSPATKLGVVGSAIFSGTSPFVAFSANQSGSTPGFISYDTTNNIMQIYVNSVERLRINALGYVGIGTTTPTYTLQVNGTAYSSGGWSSPSDARLKKDIVPIASALSIVQKLRGVRFNWRAANAREIGKDLKLPTDEKQIGFIAQEVAAVVPEAVIIPKNAAMNPYTLKEADLIPVLVEAIKEQQTQIEQLRASLAALTSATKH